MPRLLVTSAASRLAQALAEDFKTRYSVRLTERKPVTTSFEFLQCALADDAATRSLAAGMDAVVHVDEPLPGDSPVQQMDEATRGTYNLMRAAVEHKVRRFIYLSTLELMTTYESSFTVSESWRPLPPAGGRALAKHLGEFTCREFAREGRISVVVLRLGKVIPSEEVSGQPFDPLSVDARDVAQAVAAALTAKFEDTSYTAANWSVFHIASDSPRARFSVERAKSGLGYKPRFNG